MPAIPIDETELHARAAAVIDEVAPGSTIDPVAPLQGGASSITYHSTVRHADGTAERVVLKVAVAGLEPTKNRDVLRQARLQRALTPTTVPVPRVIAEHPGESLERPPFFIMSFEEGDCLEPNGATGDKRIPPDEVRARELEAARIMGELHALDAKELGLADGEPEVSPADELDRWVQSFAACDEDLREGADDVRERLMATTPPAGTSRLIHGDFRLGNTLSAGMHVNSVIDWEIWALADPRVDVGWFLMMCNPDAAMGGTIAEGMPSTEELVATYEAARGEKLVDFEWFAALVRYKQSAISSLITRNARRRGQDIDMYKSNVGRLASARELLGM